MTILVTGGFGFIGSNFVLRHLNRFPDEQVVILDKFTYAANPQNLEGADKSRLAVYRGDINNKELVANILSAHDPRAIVNFAAESHVDRSIEGPDAFVQTNIVGVANLLELSRQYNNYRNSLGESFLFLQVGTDEVYGSLSLDMASSVEDLSPYKPRSPYAASKAAADHLCKAYFETYGLPVIVTHCGNNYGPRQHVEKFIPTIITNLFADRPVPVYGTGENIREWIYVDDHCDALEVVLSSGTPGDTYNIGSNFEFKNIDLVNLIMDLMNVESKEDHIKFVNDRPGHDFRYSLDSTKMQRHFGFRATTSLNDGLAKTIEWYKSTLLA